MSTPFDNIATPLDPTALNFFGTNYAPTVDSLVFNRVAATQRNLGVVHHTADLTSILPDLTLGGTKPGAVVLLIKDTADPTGYIAASAFPLVGFTTPIGTAGAIKMGDIVSYIRIPGVSPAVTTGAVTGLFQVYAARIVVPGTYLDVTTMAGLYVIAVGALSVMLRPTNAPPNSGVNPYLTTQDPELFTELTTSEATGDFRKVIDAVLNYFYNQFSKTLGAQKSKKCIITKTQTIDTAAREQVTTYTIKIRRAMIFTDSDIPTE